MFLITHILGGIFQRFFLGIGGLTRWLFFQIYNILFEIKFPTNLDYYIDNSNEQVDKNGFKISNKNFFTALFIIIMIISLL